LQTSLCEEADSNKKSSGKPKSPTAGAESEKNPSDMNNPFRTAVSMLLYKVKINCRVLINGVPHVMLLNVIVMSVILLYVVPLGLILQ